MFKYQMIINIKNPDYIPRDKHSEEDDDMSHNEYYINFKCVEDSIDQCLDIFYLYYYKIMHDYNISNQDLIDSMHINKINTKLCPQWADLFFEK